MGSVPIIELKSADPKERGRLYGEAACNTIENTLKIYQDLFGATTGYSWEKIISLIDPYIGKVKVFAPDLIEEVKGIAEGANLSFKDIFAINARSEILFDLNIQVDECSSLAALPESTRNRSTLLAQNWDWHKAIEPCQVILKIAGRNNIPPFITFTEAGQLAKIGMNGSGVGLVVNNLNADQLQTGVPWIFVSRRILESTHLTQAMAYALSTPRAHSMNFLIAHADGEAVDIETSPVENHIIFPDGNTIAHTNHYLHPCLRFKDKESQDSNPSTYIRYHRIQKQLKSMDGNIDIESIQETLKDHFDRPFSVCVHDIQGFFPGLGTLKTCLSIVMDLSARRIFYTQGNPCQNQVETLDLTSFLQNKTH